MQFSGDISVRSQRICLTASTVSKLPGITGFFAGKRFVPRSFRVTAAIFTGVVLSFRMAANRYGYRAFLAVGGLSEPGCRVWHLRFHRALHGARLVAASGTFLFQMQIVRIHQRSGSGIHGDIPRYGGRLTALCCAAASFKMYGLPAAIAIWHSAANRKTAQSGRYHDFRRATSFLTGITEPIGSPSCSWRRSHALFTHAILAGLVPTSLYSAGDA